MSFDLPGRTGRFALLAGWELRLEGEKDTLYEDGLDIDTEGEPPAGSRWSGAEGHQGLIDCTR
jgi:hypothetical protein